MMGVKSSTAIFLFLVATCILYCQGAHISSSSEESSEVTGEPMTPEATSPKPVESDRIMNQTGDGEQRLSIQEEISSLKGRVRTLLTALVQHMGDDFQLNATDIETLIEQIPDVPAPSPGSEECIRACPLIYDPVCGSDGTTYPNQCAFESQNCKNPEVTSSPGPCLIDPCANAECDELHCPKDAQYTIGCCPRCPEDWGVPPCVFGGTCTQSGPTEDPCADAECDELPCPKDVQYKIGCCPRCPEDWGVPPCVFSGTCTQSGPTEGPDECIRPCPLIFAPVCGSDGKTYPNQCMFESQNCKNPDVTSSPGACPVGPCADVVCDKLPCPEDVQYTIGCCQECPADWGVPPCVISGTCTPAAPILDPCDGIICDVPQCGPGFVVDYNVGCCGTCVEHPSTGQPTPDPTTCGKPCHRDYRPVCGSDGITYSNLCMFEIESCKNPALTSVEGACPGHRRGGDPDSCGKPCPRIYRPVCDSDGNTHNNECLFDIEKCKNPSLTSQPGPCTEKVIEDPCADVECDELPCPKDVQYTPFGCCPRCPEDWGLPPCQLAGTCALPPPTEGIQDPCAGTECDPLPCPENLQYTYAGDCCPSCPEDWGLDPCQLSGTCNFQPTLPIDNVGVSLPADCSDITSLESGVYIIIPQEGGEAVTVFCDFDTANGPWTVIQRRQDGSVNFYRHMADYKTGFGDLDGEFWFGLDKIYNFVSQGSYQLRIDLQDGSGTRKFAVYDDFSISDESDGYRLSVGSYSGNARNSLTYHSGMQFTTRDVDNDLNTNKNCARFYKGAWWYKKCLRSNLNGRYPDPAKKHPDGLIWAFWKGYTESMTFVEMKIKRI